MLNNPSGLLNSQSSKETTKQIQEVQHSCILNLCIVVVAVRRHSEHTTVTLCVVEQCVKCVCVCALRLVIQLLLL
jgi:hypothetical protein